MHEDEAGEGSLEHELAGEADLLWDEFLTSLGVK